MMSRFKFMNFEFGFDFLFPFRCHFNLNQVYAGAQDRKMPKSLAFKPKMFSWDRQVNATEDRREAGRLRALTLARILSINFFTKRICPDSILRVGPSAAAPCLFL